MNKEIEELKYKNIHPFILKALGDLTSDAINYNQLPKITLEKENIILSYIEQLENKCESLLEDRKQLLNVVDILQNNRDKAIEVIDLITPELWNISNAMTYKLKDIKYILKGG